MRSIFKRRLVGAAAALALAGASLPAQAQDFINVLTGGTSGVYYPLGVAISCARTLSASKENGAGAPVFRPCCARADVENPPAARPAVAVANLRNWRRSNMAKRGLSDGGETPTDQGGRIKSLITS